MAWPTWARPLEPWFDKLAIWHGYEAQLETLALYTIGVAIYTGLVFTFYQRISKRQFFAREGGFWKGVAWLMAFPALSFAFWALLTLALFLLARSQTTEQIFVLSMSIVTAVRVMAYISEGAAVDLAKLLPLGLLGVLIVDPSNASMEQTWARFGDVPELLGLLGRYAVLFLVLETTLKGLRAIAVKIGKGREPRATLEVSQRVPVHEPHVQSKAKEGPFGRGR